MSEIELQDAILRHALELQRLSAHEEAQALAILQQLEDELRALLASRQLDAAGKREINELIKAANEVIAGRYDTIAGALDTQGLVALVADRTVEAMQNALAVQALRPSAERLASLSREVLIEGSPSAAWWARQGEDTAFRFAGAVRQGIVNGDTQAQIVARISGRNGFMDVVRSNARALVHSSVMTAVNRARLEVYRKNGKFISGLRWLSTLDSHSCLRCAALDGAQWDLDGNPAKGNKFVFQSPPLHWNCRCVLSPVPKSLNAILGQTGLDELQTDLSRRASKDGPIAGKTTFAEFLKRQSPTFIETTLGKKRAELFTAGKITLKDLVSGTARPLTLDELRAN